MQFWICGEIDHYTINNIICMTNRDLGFAQSCQSGLHQFESLWKQIFRLRTYQQDLVQDFRKVWIANSIKYNFRELRKINSLYYNKYLIQSCFYNVQSIAKYIFSIYFRVLFYLLGRCLLYIFKQLFSILLIEQAIQFRAHSDIN